MQIESAMPKDTDSHTLAKYYEILANVNIERKTEMFFEISQDMRELFITGIEMLHPDWSRQQISFEVIRRLYGIDLKSKVD
jgi:hypothetical protein